MRIHTSISQATDIYVALGSQKMAGRIAGHVSFKKLEHHGSTIREHGWEIQLEANERDRGRRAGNSGSYGAMQPEADGYAATFDEWGWLLAALYDLDPNMVVGSPKNPVYASRVDFDDRTAWTYNPQMWLGYVNEWPSFADERDPFPWIGGRAAKTKRGYMIGRRGADRQAECPRWGGGRNEPRTVAEVRAFAYPNEVAS